MFRRLAGLAVISVATGCSVLTAGSALASDSAQHASEQIIAIRNQGLDDMDSVVTSFQTAIAGMKTQAEVDAAADAAVAAIETIWTDAKKAIEDLMKLYPGALSSVGGDAKRQLQTRRNTAKVEIGDLANAWSPPAVTTTTTTAPTPDTTTTTTAVTTTTPGNAQGTTSTRPGNGNGTGGSGSGSGNGNSNGNGGSGSGNGSAPSGNGGGTTGSGSTGSGSTPLSNAPDLGPDVGVGSRPSTSAIPVGISDRLVIALPTLSATQLSNVPATAGSVPVAAGADATAKMSAVLDTVLPPAVVDLVLSPLLVLEILIRTTLDDGRRVLGPLAMLAVSALVIGLADRAVRRHSAV